MGWIFSMALGDSDIIAMILFGLQTSSAFALLAYQFIVSTIIIIFTRRLKYRQVFLFVQVRCHSR